MDDKRTDRYRCNWQRLRGLALTHGKNPTHTIYNAYYDQNDNRTDGSKANISIHRHNKLLLPWPLSGPLQHDRYKYYQHRERNSFTGWRSDQSDTPKRPAHQ